MEPPANREHYGARSHPAAELLNKACSAAGISAVMREHNVFSPQIRFGPNKIVEADPI
jgi:hypothetical protein